MPAALFAGVDIGGTNQSAVIATSDGAVLGRYRRRTPVGGSASDVLGNVREMLREGVAAQSSGEDPAALVGLGVGFGGPVDLHRGVVIDSHHVPGWTGFPLRETLQGNLGVPVAVENDANAGALGEAVFGAGKGYAVVLYVNVGTGVGGGIVVDGRVLHGQSGLAGEIGHVTVLPGGPQCDCGKRGCLEAVASGRSIGRRAREAAAARPGEARVLIHLAGGTLDAIQGTHVTEAASGGDPLAQAIMHETADVLGLALGNAANLLDPSVIVLGGGVATAGEILLDPVRLAVQHHLLPSMPAPPLVQAALGYDAGVMGALALSYQFISQY